MKKLLDPKWLFIVNTLPILLLFALFIPQFNIIKSLLEPGSIRLWKIFGTALALIGALNLYYAAYLTKTGRQVSVYYGLISLAAHIAFIYLYGYQVETILPFTLPRWMVPAEMMLYVGTFLMPTLAYSLYVLVVQLTPEEGSRKPWINFLLTLLVPAAWYLFLQVGLPLWQPVGSNFSVHALLIFLIVGTLLLFFFLVRGMYILAAKRTEVWKRYQLVWKLPVTLLLPLLGLAVNNGLLFQESTAGLIGDFSHPWFYILAGVNGLFICLPNLDRKLYRLLLFAGRSITFAYTFYFFLVFLPFLPVAVPAIVAVGTGFLLLTPLALFVVHAHELVKDVRYLSRSFPGRTLQALLVAGFLVLPLALTITFIGDKRTLENTLEYLYTPDYARSYEIDTVSLRNTLEAVKRHKNRRRIPLSGNQTPYISSYFNWLVLENLTLSDGKINHIEKVFFGKTSYELRKEQIQNAEVDISGIEVSSSYDRSQAAWRSWINLEISNRSGNSWPMEYASNFELPAGCWISDYYLYVGERKEKGILAEEKSAMWIYSQIRNESRDPGILYYLSGNRVALRVFPFAKDEVRRTGIEFIHKEPVTLQIDGRRLQLGGHAPGEAKAAADARIESPDIAYVSAARKQSLPQVQRRPYFHFLIDTSQDNAFKLDEFEARIEALMEQYPDVAGNARISRVNSYVATSSAGGNWEAMFSPDQFAGGFFLERAIETALISAYRQHDTAYPVFIVVTDDFSAAVLDKDFSDIRITFPEHTRFYHLAKAGQLVPHSLIETPREPIAPPSDLNFYAPALEYKGADGKPYYISTGPLPSIVLKAEFIPVSADRVEPRDWDSALRMQGSWISQQLDPSSSDTARLNLIKSSFASKVMTPVTSYIAVENRAQKAMLKRKQQQILSGNQALDAGEEAQRMSEPPMIMLLAPLSALFWIRRKRRR